MFFSKLKENLKKTKEAIDIKISNVFANNKDIDEIMDDLEETLILSDIGVETSMKICNNVRDNLKKQIDKSEDAIKKLLKQEMKNILAVSNNTNIFDNNEKQVIMVVGVNGVGKTTSIAKLSNLLKKEGKNITGSVMQLFLSRTGTDMGNIDRELEKLICYALDRDVITAEDVMAVTTEQTTNKIFEMVNAIAEHNQRKALDLYYDLLTLKEPPMRIMFLITRQFQILLNVRDMAGRGMDNQSIAKNAGIPPFAVKRNISQAKGFTMAQLKRALYDGADLEESVKTGRMNDQMAIELFIMKYSRSEK